MEPIQAIIAGTKNSAEAIGIEKIVGTIEPDKIADIIAFKGNPLADIKALQDVDFVMKDGQVLYTKDA
jgi:imidazolonepropionase-like amidohydrolase